MKTYKRNEVCHFSKAKGKWGELGNMTGGFGFSIGDTLIMSSESLYQAMRFTFYPGIQREILAQNGGMGAKMVAKKYRNDFTRSDWDDVRVEIMWWCLQLKFAYHTERLGPVLIETDTRDIVEESRNDNFWGAIPNDDELIGENMLGELWMIVRSHYLHDVETGDKFHKRIRTPRIQNFQILGDYITDIEVK